MRISRSPRDPARYTFTHTDERIALLSGQPGYATAQIIGRLVIVKVSLSDLLPNGWIMTRVTDYSIMRSSDATGLTLDVLHLIGIDDLELVHYLIMARIEVHPDRVFLWLELE